ncbi:MAG: hypothetical protein HY308_06945 [Gammaproteobacteria bacterium]|nr:hypothetical protein [Gammaproteobacteria bacterium]
MEVANVPSYYQTAIEQVTAALTQGLGENLYSCVLYGSAVRGDIVPKVSDINLLLVLNESTPEAHSAIAAAVRGKVVVSPFIVGRRGMERTVECFPIKFRSIKRHYRVLAGVDPFDGINVSQDILRFLCEQSLRNLRLRCVHFFVVSGNDRRRYPQFLLGLIAKIFTDLSELLRLSGIEVANDFDARIAPLEQHLGVDASVLHDLLKLKQDSHRLSADEIENFHSRLFRLLDSAVQWMEVKWPRPTH